MNDENNYIVVLYGLKLIEFKNLDEHILNSIRETFKEECIKDEVIERFINDSQKIVYSKTSSGSMISKLNNVCTLLPHFDDMYVLYRSYKRKYIVLQLVQLRILNKVCN